MTDRKPNLAMLLGATIALLATGLSAEAASWYVYLTPERTCVVVNAPVRGYGKLAGPMASKAQATQRKDNLATCSKANTERSTGSGPAGSR